MVDIAASDLHIDNVSRVGARRYVDVQNGNAHIGKCGGNIGKHTDTVVDVDLQKSLIDAVTASALNGAFPVCFLPTGGVFGG